MSEPISTATLRLRIRNNIIDYLELAASPTEQLAYEQAVPIAWVPAEIINMWEDHVRCDDFDWYCEPEFSSEEQIAIRRFHAIWDRAAAETPTPMPARVETLIGTPAWQMLMDSAAQALAVFARRGRLAEGD